jgi:hypothetical protein
MEEREGKLTGAGGRRGGERVTCSAFGCLREFGTGLDVRSPVMDRVQPGTTSTLSLVDGSSLLCRGRMAMDAPHFNLFDWNHYSGGDSPLTWHQVKRE